MKEEGEIMATVPTGPLSALYTNTTSGVVADPNVMDAAIQIIVKTINDNWTEFQSFITAAELNVADGSVTSPKIRDGAVTQTKIIKEAVTQFTYDFVQIDQKISDVVLENIPQSVIDAIATTVNQELVIHMADYVKHPADGGTTSGTATAYISSASNPLSLVDKAGIVITAHVNSGANPTLKWGTLTAYPMLKANGSAASLKKDGIYTLRFSAPKLAFILQGEGGGGTAVAADILSGKTATTDAGDVTGTMNNQGAVALTVTNPSDRVTIPQGYHNGNGYATATYEKRPVNASGTMMSDDYGKLTVSGLGFQPRVVTARATGFSLADNYITTLVRVNGNVFFARRFGSSSEGGVSSLKGQEATYNITSDGFVLNIDYGRIAVAWTAEA